MGRHLWRLSPESLCSCGIAGCWGATEGHEGSGRAGSARSLTVYGSSQPGLGEGGVGPVVAVLLWCAKKAQAVIVAPNVAACSEGQIWLNHAGFGACGSAPRAPRVAPVDGSAVFMRDRPAGGHSSKRHRGSIRAGSAPEHRRAELALAGAAHRGAGWSPSRGVLFARGQGLSLMTVLNVREAGVRSFVHAAPSASSSN
jgi:hypothetical protein